MKGTADPSVYDSSSTRFLRHTAVGLGTIGLLLFGVSLATGAPPEGGLLEPGVQPAAIERVIEAPSIETVQAEVASEPEAIAVLLADLPTS